MLAQVHSCSRAKLRLRLVSSGVPEYDSGVPGGGHRESNPCFEALGQTSGSLEATLDKQLIIFREPKETGIPDHSAS